VIPHDDIKLAIERAAGFPARYLHSAPVVETFNGKPVWEGMVDVYRVASRPISTAYGWAVDNGKGEPEFVAVLGRSPINSPLEAVRSWLVKELRINSQ
jgi:hypothetical protein